MPDRTYTEGICGEGAAILKNGELLTITDILNTLNMIESMTKAVEGALRIDALWIYETASIEHEEEAKALHLMRQSFLDALERS